MKKAELEAKLESLKASELAELAGEALDRGRPSAELRSRLVAKIMTAIKAKKITVKRDGTIVRK